MAPVQDVESTLWERERGFWTGGAEYYRRNLSDDVLMVFRRMMLDKHRTIESIVNAPRWTTVTFERQQCLPLADDVIAIHYQATAERESAPSQYRALVTSVYLRRNGEWLLAIHQQTP